MPGNNPCQECTKRYIGCHGECKAYLEWRDAYTKMHKQIRHNRHQKGIGYLGEHYRRNCK